MIPRILKQVYRVFIPAPKKEGWFGNYSSWKDAKSITRGYDLPLIVEKVKTAILKVKAGEAVYERDSVLFYKNDKTQEVLDTLTAVAKENNGHLSVLDFGGSLGSTYFQYRSYLKDLKSIDWRVVEQARFVKTGKEFIEDEHLHFFESIELATKENKPSLLLLSSVLQYVENPYELLRKMMDYQFNYILIDRTAFINSTLERITIQVVPDYIYKATYPAWFMNEHSLIQLFLSSYDVVFEFISKIEKPIKLEDGKDAYWKGFLLKRKK